MWLLLLAVAADRDHAVWNLSSPDFPEDQVAEETQKSRRKNTAGDTGPGHYAEAPLGLCVRRRLASRSLILC